MRWVCWRNGWGDRRDGSAPVMGRSWAGDWAVRTGWRWRKKREDEESGGRRKKEVKPERENGKCLLMREERESVIKNSFFFLHVSYSAHLKIDVHCS